MPSVSISGVNQALDTLEDVSGNVSGLVNSTRELNMSLINIADDIDALVQACDNISMIPSIPQPAACDMVDADVFRNLLVADFTDVCLSLCIKFVYVCVRAGGRITSPCGTFLAVTTTTLVWPWQISCAVACILASCTVCTAFIHLKMLCQVSKFSVPSMRNLLTCQRRPLSYHKGTEGCV